MKKEYLFNIVIDPEFKKRYEHDIRFSFYYESDTFQVNSTNLKLFTNPHKDFKNLKTDCIEEIKADYI